MAEMFAIWLICGVVCATVASSKGRSGLSWFFVGALFGPFGIIAAFGVSKQESGVPCPFCRKLIDPLATICPYCRSEVSRAAKPVRQPPPALAPRTDAEKARDRAQMLALFAAIAMVLVAVLLVQHFG